MPDDAHVDAFLLPEQIGFWLGVLLDAAESVCQHY